MEKPLTEELYLDNVNKKMAGDKPGAILPILFLALFCAAAGCGIALYQGAKAHLLQLAGFLLLGLLVTFFTQKKLPAGKAMLAAIGIAIVTVAGVAVMQQLRGGFSLQALLPLGAAFLLPEIVIRAWQQFVQMQPAPPALWRYSTNLPQRDGLVYLENRNIRFKVITASGGKAAVPTRSPAQWSLGLAFYYTMQDAERKKEIAPQLLEDIERGSWSFYKVAFGIMRVYLDPAATLFENRITDKDIIFAEHSAQ
jgi:hypothetical protein